MTTLRLGDNGSEVRKLQTALNRVGAALTVDGAYGPKTVEAVKKFQANNGLQVDGVTGPKTWAKLEAVPKDNNQVYNALVTCLDAIEELPEFKTLCGLLE